MCRFDFFVAEFIINLIGDHENVLFFAKFCDLFANFWFSDNAGRVTWRIEEKNFGFWSNRSFDTLWSDLEVWVGIDEDWGATCEGNEVLVHDEVWVWDENFIARLDSGHESEKKAT